MTRRLNSRRRATGPSPLARVKHCVGTRVTEATYAVLQAVATYEDERISVIVRRAVLHYLARHAFVRQHGVVNNPRQDAEPSIKLRRDGARPGGERDEM